MSNSEINLKLWRSVSTTDERFTKHANQRGGFTSISPAYQAKQATEKFGPYGVGWGLCESDIDFSLIESTGLITNKAVFFYVLNDKRVEFPISNSVVIKYNNRVDPDAIKKLETNTISKALSRLGFNADVFMGLFDDMEYLRDLNEMMAVAKAADKESEKARIAQELEADALKTIEQIDSATTLTVVEGLFKAMARKLNGKNDKLLLKLTKAKDNAKERLND